MKQEIVCNHGKCSEVGTIESEFDSLFSGSNIVEKIQRDLIKNMLK